MAMLVWHHTEFGRRSACETFHVVHSGSGWLLLDADWNEIGDPTPSVDAALNRAEQVAARRAREAARAQRA